MELEVTGAGDLGGKLSFWAFNCSPLPNKYCLKIHFGRVKEESKLGQRRELSRKNPPNIGRTSYITPLAYSLR